MKNIRCADCGHLSVHIQHGVECQAPVPFWSDEGEPKTLSIIEVLSIRTCDAFEKKPGDANG